MIKHCIVCGKEFEPKRKSQVTCLSRECVKERGRRYQRKYSRDATMVAGLPKNEYKRLKQNEYRQKARELEMANRKKVQGKCPTCMYCESDGLNLCCVNGSSPFCADFVLDTGTCDEWEKRQGKAHEAMKK